MRQTYKDIIVGLILASFIFTPTAFAKPQGGKPRAISKKEASKPLYSDLIRTIRKSKGGLKVSDMTEAAAPMVRRREYKDIRKMMVPFWDKKFDQVTIGSDYFKLSYKGYHVFARYVDRGPVAFIVNNQPLLWKDILIYGRAKSRMIEILRGKKRPQKVSFIESVLEQIVPKAFAENKEEEREKACQQLIDSGLAVAPDSGDLKKDGCICTEQSQRGANGPVAAHLETDESGTERVIHPPQCGAAVVPPTPPEPIVPDVIPPEPTQKNKWLPLLLIGGAMLLLLLLMKKKRKKKKDPTPEPPPTPTPTPEPPPTPAWDPEPEGQCPTPGARGLTEADLPPECRKSSCQQTNSCGNEGSGSIY